MEIKFKNISLKKGNKIILNDLDLTISNDVITGIYNNHFLKYIFLDNIEYDGEILIDNNNYKSINKNIISCINGERTYLTKTISDEFYLVKRNMFDDTDYVEKVISSLNMVGLDKDYLDREVDFLSKSEKVLLNIALSLIINPEIIILDNIFINLDNKHKLIIKKLVYELKKKYKKMIIIIDKDINVLYDVCNYFILFGNKNAISNKKSLVFKDLNSLKENDIEIPEIIKFIDNASSYDVKLSYYNDVNDLIKDVYRNVNKNKR